MITCGNARRAESSFPGSARGSTTRGGLEARCFFGFLFADELPLRRRFCDLPPVRKYSGGSRVETKSRTFSRLRAFFTPFSSGGPTLGIGFARRFPLLLRLKRTTVPPSPSYEPKLIIM